MLNPFQRPPCPAALATLTHGGVGWQMLRWRLIIQGDTHLSLDGSGAANARLLANPSGSGLMLVSFHELD